MSSIELNETLLKKLESAGDALVRDILALIEFESNQKTYALSDAEKAKIEKGLKQSKEDKTFTNEEVEKEMYQWLNQN